jgi:MFS family permease
MAADPGRKDPPPETVDGQQSRSPISAPLAAVIASPLGMAAGAATCYVLGEWDQMQLSVVLGAALGAVVGIAIVAVSRLRTGEGPRQDVGAAAGFIVGLSPAMMIVFKLGGELSGMLVAGAAFVGPMIGLLLGALLDRATDELRDGRWGAAVLFGGLGVGLCSGLVSWIDSGAYGKPPEEVATIVQELIAESWSEDPLMEGAIVDKLQLRREGRRSYRGTFTTAIAEFDMPFTVQAWDDGDAVRVEWEPAE